MNDTDFSCFLVQRKAAFVYESKTTYEQLEQGQDPKHIIHQTLVQRYQNQIFRSMYIKQILPDILYSNITAISDREGGLLYQACVQTNIITKQIPELILVNCQIKEVNQTDENIVQLICRGFGDLSDVNIFVRIDDSQKTQKHFQVDQIIPALIQQTIYRINCNFINCNAFPMYFLDVYCYFVLSPTPKNASADTLMQYEINMKQVHQHIEKIQYLQKELEKYPKQLLSELVSIFSQNKFTLEQPQLNKDQVNISTFVNALKDENRGQINIKLNISDYTNAQLTTIQQIPESLVITVQYESLGLLEIAKDIMFWLRFMLECCQVYTPKNINNLKSLLLSQQ